MGDLVFFPGTETAKKNNSDEWNSIGCNVNYSYRTCKRNSESEGKYVWERSNTLFVRQTKYSRDSVDIKISNEFQEYDKYDSIAEVTLSVADIESIINFAISVGIME